METIEQALLNSQSKIIDEIKGIGDNFRKDSASRKITLEYHDSRLDKLKALWNQFQENDAQLAGLECEKTGPYYEKGVYQQVEGLYEETQLAIARSRRRVVEKSMKENTTDEMDTDGKGIRGPGSSKQPEFNIPPLSDHGKKEHREQQGLDQRTYDILNEQRSNVRAFERAVSTLKIEDIKEKWQLEDKLRTLTQRWEKVDNIYWKLDNLLDNMDAYENDYNRLERLYEDSKEQINKKIWEQKHQEQSAPKIDLPIFSGNYAQWTTFKDLFLEIVHNNAFISNAQKMQHLKAKLRGEPERLIQHMTISADNYEASWKIVQQRYDNKRLLFTYQAKTLLNQPVIQGASASQLKKMHDTTVECLHAIKNLNFDTDSWDPLLVHILIQKLDSDTIQSFTESLDDPRAMPTLNEFLKFIETRFMSLETSGNPNRNRNTFNTQHGMQAKTATNAMNNKPKVTQHQLSYENKGPKPFYNTKSFHNFISCPKCKRQHGLYKCREFLSLGAEERLKTVNDLRVCKNCLFSHNGESCMSKQTCKICNDAHSSILHEAIEKMRLKQTNSGHNLNTHVAHDSANEVLLATAQVKVMAKDGTYITLRALIDQGSQVTLITENAAQRLQLKRSKMSAVVSGIGASPSAKCKGVVQLKCQALYTEFNFDMDALVTQTLTNSLPSKTIDKSSFEHLQHLKLADPDFNISAEIDLLLGADVFSEILLEGLIKTNTSSIIAQQTQLGWIVCGKYKTLNCHVIINNLQDIAKFWENESVLEDTEEIDMNDKCERLYTQTTTRLPDGRYQVRLPLKCDIAQKLGKSKPQAIAQFQQLERKLTKNPTFAKDYKDFIHEYKQMDHMKEATSNADLEYYLPHHGVIRPGAVTTKLRVVFNASAKTSTKHSLNDLMETGPNLQKDIFTILLKWRQYKYVLTSDIEKMYRFIAVHPEHQALQKIVWRDTPKQLLKEYQLCTVTYGTKAAPYLALRTLQQLAIDEGDKYPDAKEVLQKQFFVDDALFGKDTIEDARATRDHLIQLLKKGGFNLRKWSSNDVQLIDDLPDDMKSPLNLTFTEVQTSKALGLSWKPKDDEFIFTSSLKHSNKNINKNATKRQILSDISTLYDPLGWMSPLTVKAKILFQQIWKHKIEWDDTVPDDIQKEWATFLNELTNMQPFNIKRWLGFAANLDCELHAFCDASEKAYACVVYSTVRESTGKIQVSLVAAKTKVAPIQKQQTLPRLELCGAQLLAQLVKKVKHCLNMPNIKVTAWTDSMVVLGWLQGDVSRWKAFVAHRVTEITSIVPSEDWNHVRSDQNPADCASRGLLPSQLRNFSLWFDGPGWLHTGEMSKTLKTKQITTDIEAKVHVVTSPSAERNIILQLLDKNSCIMKTTKVLAWVSRFINNTRHHEHESPTCRGTPRPAHAPPRQCNLTLADIQQATNTIIREVQNVHYEAEINDLKRKGKVNNSSKLLKLNPFLDKQNILRVGGRLQHSTLSEDAKHPIIIPKESRLAQLLIDRAHAITLHGGARLTLAKLRQQYWIIGGNNTIKKQLGKCVKCCRFKSTRQQQLMADLPRERTTPTPPFYHTGVDFTGCVDVRMNKGRLQEVHPGKDGLIRVVTLKTKGGILTRPITKLVKLPVNNEEKPKDTVPSTPKNQEEKSPKKRFKAKGTNNSFLCLLVTLLALCHPTKQSSDIITVNQFEQHRLVFFDKIGNLQSVHDDWKIVTYYNMTSYWQGISNIQRVIEHLKGRCEKFSYQAVCRTIVSEFQQQLHELEHNNYMLQTHHGQIKGRVTRGLINGIGYLANSLFGVLDERFAEQYKNDIETLHHDKDHLLTLIKGQTTIIEAHNNILKRNEETMNLQFNLISKHLNATELYLHRIGQKIQDGENMDYFNIMALASTTILSKLRHIQHMLLDTATNIHHGHVDTRLLPQSQLLQELNTISGQLPQHLSLPVDDIQNQLADIYKLLEVKSRIIDMYFIIEITLPLTSDNQFTLYKTVPIPALTEKNDLFMIKTSSEYVAINIRKETYMQISDKDLEHCIKVEPITFVCSLSKPTLNMRSQHIPCEIGAVTNSTSKNCIYETNNCINKWTPLHTPNTWLYVCCKDCQLQVICGNNMISKAIHQTGIVKAKEGCVIRNGEETFYTQVHYENKIFNNPEVPTIELGDINNLTSTYPIEFPTLPVNTQEKTDYEGLQKAVREIKDHANETEMTSHDIHQYIVSYSTLGLVVVLALAAGGSFVLWRRRKERATVARPLPAPPKPPRMTSSTNIASPNFNI